MERGAIQLAYRAKDYIPTEEYRRGRRKKMYNPIKAAPALAQAMDHMGETEFTLLTARERAQQVILEPEAARHISYLDWGGLRDFLNVLSIFLKAHPSGKEKNMRAFEDRENRELSSADLGERAQDLAGKLYRTEDTNNPNKLKRLSARIAAAGDKWEALASLAQFYPLSGVPKGVIDELVEELETIDLRSFKELVAHSLIYYEASSKGWRQKMTNEELLPSLARLSDLEIRLYRLETKSHLRIGAGEGAVDVSAAENPLIRALMYVDEKEKRVPYVPGSSLHGVIRSWVEKVLRSQGEPLSREVMEEKLEQVSAAKAEAKKEFKDLLGHDVNDDQLFEHWLVYPEVCDPLLGVDKCERISTREAESRRWKCDWCKVIGRKVPCHVCGIFGYMGQRGRVKISHGFPSQEDLPIDIITRVAINRLTGAADEHKLFDLEAIPPGAVFHFFVVLENMSPEQKRSFEKGVRALNLQVASLGAHSTIGFGMVEVEPVFTAAVDPDIFDLKVEEILPAMLKDEQYQLRADLDRGKYPDFFLALSLLDRQTKQPPVDRFNNLIGYR